MGSPRRHLASLLVLVVFAASVVPCLARVAPASPASAPAHETTMHHASGATGHGAHASGHASTFESNRLLEAPCACGCGDRDGSGSSVGRLASALPTCAPTVGLHQTYSEIAAEAVCPTEAPVRQVDHVPLFA